LEELERLCDLLFEISNEDRVKILLQLRTKPLRVSNLSRELGLSIQEISRHVSRLGEAGLAQKNVDGYHSLTSFGEMILEQLQELDFSSKHRDYFTTHTQAHLPRELAKRLSDLGDSEYTDDAMDYFRFTENLFRESKEYVWLLVDQFPLNSLPAIIEAIERGVKFKIIEPRDRALDPDIDSMTSEENQALSRARQTPLIEQRMLDEVNTFLYLSERMCVLALPASDGQYDYKGFTATDKSSLDWCIELFDYYWGISAQRTPAPPAVHVKRGQIAERVGAPGRIVVTGRSRPDYDVQAIQDAVDNFDEVILKGVFNLGTSMININRSVVIRGEGRENDFPTTIVFKHGWTFPTFTQEFAFIVSGEDIDVTIENIHFTDFNYCCIFIARGNSVAIRNNRINLRTGLGRGVTLGRFQDVVIGIMSGSFRGQTSFSGGIRIEGNYLDFELSYAQGGFFSRGDLEKDPNYRPDLVKHESYCGMGIVLQRNIGEVIVRNNEIRNMNARGIVIQDNFESAAIHIMDNIIISEVYGSYPFTSHIAAMGIFVQSAWVLPMSGSHVVISGNEIRCDKLNYCGIAVYGPSMYQEGAGKLGECIVRDNDIHLGDGSVGVLIRKNDRTEVFDNKISGKVYYGFHLWGSRDREGFNLGSNENMIEDNDMADLEIKAPDEYSDSHVDGRMFTGSEGKSATGHVWLNKLTAMNTVKIKTSEIVIDEGKNNTIKRN
jgi:predicted transcriptional regulator